MKSLTLILLPVIFLVQICTMQNADTNSIKLEDITTRSNKKIDFEKEVLPVLVKNCSPCHFTGGKMYERMPFDKDTTIINHGDKILKRIKNNEENTLLKTFLLQNKNGSQ